MTIALRLLDGVSYDGRPVPGTRSADLLAALVLERAGVADSRLLEAVWADQPPATAKALQVQVSRVRSQCGPDVVQRYDGGYRLGLPPDAVDLWVLESSAEAARAALTVGDPQAALRAVERADVLATGVAENGGEGPLSVVRRRARAWGPSLVRSRALALARSGREADALPDLESAHARDPDDTEVLTALLRSEAGSVGTPVALARYDSYRRDLADRLGVDPAPELQRVHRELLATDDPVRSGVQYEPDELLGRDDDLAGLRSLVRTGRLTTILGPGGLGKTRVAHVLAREATQPRVHFVELVGISSPDDVVSEVGSALGVRNSVTGRRTLTAAQLADVRARIAQELDSVPTLLVLDNCEHVLDATASLVAFLLVTTRDLRVVTTSRSPLGIAAERVFPLSQLAPADGAELFRRRAVAVRPDADLPDDVVDEIVARLDGLPLAVELAAARVRTMSADEVRRALDDRFALLRSRDRSAPARHQTLTAVIGWSWDLLSAAEQRALSWLSVFQDGFSADAARVVLGPAGADLVEALVDQSLVAVTEHGGVTRHRMLETVREFGAHRLAAAGDGDAARAALSGWAVGLSERVRPDLFGPRQVEVVDVLDAEEANLADVLRRSLLADDAPVAVPLLAALAGLWSVTGNFPRFLAMAEVGEKVLLDWVPPPELEEVTAEAVALMLMYLGFMRPDGVADLVAVLRGLPEPRRPWTRVAREMFLGAESSADRRVAVLRLTEDPDRRTAAMAWQWAAIVAENEGATDDSYAYLQQALAMVDDDTTVWEEAMLHTQLAMHAFNRGRFEEGTEHARRAIPLLRRLHANDDAISMSTSVALAALRQGRLEEAHRLLDDIGEPAASDVTATLVRGQVSAELLLISGDVEGGLTALDRSLETVGSFGWQGMSTNGLEPWLLIPLATALAAHAAYADTEARRTRGRELAARATTQLRRIRETPEAAIDFPVTGMGLAALGSWLLTEELGDERSVEAGVRLVALAHGVSYNRWFPEMDWDRLERLAEGAAPGRLVAVLEEYDGRQGRELRPEVERVLDSVRLTSSA